MIDYNPKLWFSITFRFQKSDMLRKLFWELVIVALYAGIISYLLIEVFHEKKENFDPTSVHSVLGFVLSLLLVFRTNGAYDRWWEGRKQWGSLVNSSRNLMTKISTLSISIEEKENFQQLISAYAVAAKEHLRKGVNIADLAIADKYLETIQERNHIPNAIIQLIYLELNNLRKNKVISDVDLLNMDGDLTTFSDVIGACERIKKTPIPYSYNVFLKQFILVFIASLPFSFIMHFDYWAIPITLVIFYVFVSLELIAEEIEDPFGKDDNDLPLDDIAQTIANNTKELIV